MEEALKRWQLVGPGSSLQSGLGSRFLYLPRTEGPLGILWTVSPSGQPAKRPPYLTVSTGVSTCDVHKGEVGR